MKLVLAAAMPLLAVACAPLPPLDTSSSFVAVADVSSPVSILQVGSALSYRDRAIKEPVDWTSLNNEQIEGAE